METEVKELLEQAGVPSIEVTALEVAEIVEQIGDCLSEVTGQVLWLIEVIPSLGSEFLDKLEEQLTRDWGDSPIFESARGCIVATINNYRQDKILKELDEKFRRIKEAELSYNALSDDCANLLNKLTMKNVDSIDTRKYHSVFVDTVIDEYRIKFGL